MQQWAAMRTWTLLLVLAGAAHGQFRSTVPLVVVPASITDAGGRYVDGLDPADLLLYDNSVPQKVHMEWSTYPISLVVAVETCANSGAVIDKLGGSGILFAQLLAAERGETAVISFADRVTAHQDFTADSDAVTHSLRMLRMEGGGACMLDAMTHALDMLERRPPGRRRIILMIAEKHDRGSRAKLAEAMERVQRMNAAIYWLTYSPFLQPFTVRPKTVEDTKPEAERIKTPACALCPHPDDSAVPADLGPGGFIYALGELFRLHHEDLSELFTATTGGRALSFLKKDALEHAIQLVGEEVHREYVLTFQPRVTDAGKYHAIRVAVRGRPELTVRAREGYWSLP